ncbi:hypothetical protein QOT17_005291 [Balamuthia mandrillaris]
MASAVRGGASSRHGGSRLCFAALAGGNRAMLSTAGSACRSTRFSPSSFSRGLASPQHRWLCPPFHSSYEFGLRSALFCTKATSEKEERDNESSAAADDDQAKEVLVYENSRADTWRQSWRNALFLQLTGSLGLAGFSLSNGFEVLPFSPAVLYISYGASLVCTAVIYSFVRPIVLQLHAIYGGAPPQPGAQPGGEERKEEEPKGEPQRPQPTSVRITTLGFFLKPVEREFPLHAVREFRGYGPAAREGTWQVARENKMFTMLTAKPPPSESSSSPISSAHMYYSLENTPESNVKRPELLQLILDGGLPPSQSDTAPQQ